MKYLVSGREMKNWEKKAVEQYKLPAILLMERAAMAVAEALKQEDFDLHRVLIACGTGNNGGDGLAIARLLKMKGIHVQVCMTGPLDKLTPDAKLQLEMYQAISGEFVTSPVYDEYTVIVDAVFGIGLNRPVSGIAAEVLEGIQASGVPVVAVDVPSGISSDTGKVCGVAVKADLTVTFFTEKAGLMLYPGHEYCGRIMVADMGIPFKDCPECKLVTYTDEDLERLPGRSNHSHKGTFGKVLVIAGSPKICGAAYLCAAGAYKTGAGLVKVYTPKENIPALQTLLPEALLEGYDRSRPSVKELKACMEWADVIVIGPGLGTDRAAEKILSLVIGKSHVPVVVDADGINLLAKNKTCLLDSPAPLILTPHIQEMARLTGKDKEEILKNPYGAANDFADEYEVTMVLKDARTYVAMAGELTYVNTCGNSGMATGGSGDVLAGILCGLLAQGMEPLKAARLGVFLHGKAGDMAAEKYGAYSMTATSLLEGIGEVTKNR